MKVRVLAIVILLMSIMPVCLARNFYSTGIAVNQDLEVLGVNVNGPAYLAGIRPGDVILSVHLKEKILNLLDAKEALYSRDNKNTMSILYKRDNEEIRTTIESAKDLDGATKSTFLIKGYSQENYEKLVKALTFNPSIFSLFPIQSTDSNLKMIRTYSNITRQTIKELNLPIYSYLSGFAGGNMGMGLTVLDTMGNFAFKNSNAENFAILKIDLSFRAQVKSLFGQSWGNFTSTGLLEKKIIECMYEEI